MWIRQINALGTVILDMPLGCLEQKIYSEFGMKGTWRPSVSKTKRLVDNIEVDIKQ
jgi:hypothetical protein